MAEPELNTMLGDLLPQVFGDDVVVLKWVAVAETMALDTGERSLYTMAHPGQPQWDTDALLAHAGEDDEDE